MSYRAVGYVIRECREVRGNHHNVLVAMAFVARDDMGLLVWASERKIAERAHISPTTLRGQTGKEGEPPRRPGPLDTLPELGHIERVATLSRKTVLWRVIVPPDAPAKFRLKTSLRTEDEAFRWLLSEDLASYADARIIAAHVDATAPQCGAVEEATTAPHGDAVDEGDEDTSARATAHTTAHTTASQGDAVSEKDQRGSGTTSAPDVSESPRDGLVDHEAQSDAEVARASAHAHEHDAEPSDTRASAETQDGAIGEQEGEAENAEVGASESAANGNSGQTASDDDGVPVDARRDDGSAGPAQRILLERWRLQRPAGAPRELEALELAAIAMLIGAVGQSQASAVIDREARRVTSVLWQVAQREERQAAKRRTEAAA